MSYEEVGRNNTSAGSVCAKISAERKKGEVLAAVGMRGNDVWRRRYVVFEAKMKSTF